MRQFLTAAFVLLSFSAMAGERIYEVDVYKNNFELDGKARKFTIWNFDIRNVEKKVKIIEDDFCGSDEISCTQRVVLEREQVLQLTVQYEDDFSVDSEYEYVEVNLPLNTLSSEDLEKMKSYGGFWDLTGKKARARMNMAKKNFEMVIKDRKKTIQVIDYYNSTLCDIGDGHWCREDIRYETKIITVKDFSIQKK